MKVLAVDFIGYEVSDMDQAIAFYRDVLGLELISNEGGAFAEFNVPPTTLALYAPGVHESRPPRIGGGAVALAVDDVAAAVEELKAKGVTVTFGPYESPVCHMAFILDPDGNSVGLHHRKDGTAG